MAAPRQDLAPLPASPGLLPLGAIAAGFGLLNTAAWAQGAEPAPPPSAASAPVNVAELQLETVHVNRRADTAKDSVRATTSTIGKGNQELRDIPQSVTVVTEKLIDDRNLDTLKDALKNTAGISFQAAEGGEEDIRLRGFSLQSTGDIFIDGMRDPAFYDRDSFNWDRLELLRGSASMLFGRGSTGGAVNQVSKQPRLIDESEVALTIGDGGYVRGTGDFNLRTGESAALRIAAMDALADGNGVKIDKQGIAPTWRWGIGTADEFSIGLFHLNNHNGIHYGLPWLTPGPRTGGGPLWPTDPKNYYGLRSDYLAGGTSQGTASHVHRFAGGGVLKTALRVANYWRDQRASAIRFAPAALQPDGQAVTTDTFSDATVLQRSNNTGVQAKIMNMHTVALQSDYSGSFGWFGLVHAVLAGVDAAHEQFRNFGLGADSPTLTKPRTTVGTPNDGASVDEGARTLRATQDFDAKAFGVYVQDLVQVAPAWKLLGGIRWDRFEGHYHQPQLLNAAGTETQADAVRERGDSLWSRRLGVLYQPTPRQSYHFSYGTSFNTSGDTYRFDALGSKTPPEGSRNIELGARLDSAGGHFTTRLALFHAVKTNERNRDEESVTPTSYVLSGKRHASGLEIDITGRLGPAWEVYGSYAFIPDARIDQGASDGTTLLQGETVGARPGLTPRHSGTIWTTYKLTPAWRIGAGLNARGGMTPLQSTIVAPRYLTADLMAEVVLRWVAFKLNVSNVTDKHYADMLYRGHYVPGKPRTIQLTSTVTF